MPRDHARILCRIWEDDEFVSLDEGAQRLYMLLLSQRSVSHAGVMALQVSKWAKRGPTTSESDVQGFLSLLADKEYIVIDLYTEELFIRSFLRNDGILVQPNMIKAALSASKQIESQKLRSALADELERLDEDFGRLPRPEVQAAARAAVQRLRGTATSTPRDPQPTPTGGPAGDFATPSVSPTGGHQTGQNASPVKANRGPRVGSGVGEGVRGKGSVGINSSLEKNKNPREIARSNETDHAATPDDEFALLTPPDSSESVVSINRKADELFDRFWTTYPRRNAKPQARKAWDKAIKRADPETIITAAHALAESNPDLKYTPYPATWLNRDAWNDPIEQPGRSDNYRGYQAPTDNSVYYGKLLP